MNIKKSTDLSIWYDFSEVIFLQLENNGVIASGQH